MTSGTKVPTPSIRRQAGSVEALPTLYTYREYVHNCIMQHHDYYMILCASVQVIYSQLCSTNNLLCMYCELRFA